MKQRPPRARHVSNETGLIDRSSCTSDAVASRFERSCFASKLNYTIRSDPISFIMRTSFLALVVAFCVANKYGLAFTTSQRKSSTTTTALAANIAVFGASGLTGAECVYQALQNGDTVVGLTRCVLH
jgi:hypothetical protein